MWRRWRARWKTICAPPTGGRDLSTAGAKPPGTHGTGSEQSPRYAIGLLRTVSPRTNNKTDRRGCLCERSDTIAPTWQNAIVGIRRQASVLAVAALAALLLAYLVTASQASGGTSSLSVVRAPTALATSVPATLPTPPHP